MQIPADLRLAVPLLGIGALWLVSAWGVAFIANHRRANWWSWFALGLLGGPIAWLGVLRTGKICHHCRSKINLKARICPACDLPQTYKDLTTELRPHPEGLVARSGKDGEI